jgi:hypothetical protein
MTNISITERTVLSTTDLIEKLIGKKHFFAFVARATN